jgi:tRNA A-37 threonylcarbamoyl transferase component Bud32
MRFASKKNCVTLKDGIIIKEHSDKEALLREAAALERLRSAGLAVPALLGQDATSLRLEYIQGPTYVELVDEMTAQQAQALADWLGAYQSITGLLRGDCNLRNFLWCNGKCVGVDFEDKPTRGDREVDMGKILAFAVTYEPALTEAKRACGRLVLQAMLQTGGDLWRIRSAYLDEIASMNRRRKHFDVKAEEAASFFDAL